MRSLAYIGTYADAIYYWRFGELPTVAAAAPRPSYLAVHPNRAVLYAVSEVPDGAVSAWRIDRDNGALTFCSRQSSGGEGPCHVAVDPGGRILVVPNYGTGSLTAIRICSDGSLGEVLANHAHAGSGPSPRQSKPHPHGCFFSPEGQLAVVPDLGGDKLFLYRAGASFEPAELPAITLAAGSGPRHVAFHPSGMFAYALCELTSTVTAFRCRDDRLEPFAVVSTVLPDYRGANVAAGITVDDTGRFLYCSNRGADTIAVFAIGVRGEPVTVQHVDAGGRTPRHIAIDPSGAWFAVANQDSDAVALLARHAVTGRLEPPTSRFAVSKPACVAFV